MGSSLSAQIPIPEDSALGRIRTGLRNIPEYSILLEDMKQEGFFFTRYLHRYRIIRENTNRTTSWKSVTAEFHNACFPFLGMVIAGKIEGRETIIPAPPGFQYLGNRRYGQWIEDYGNCRYWEFYETYSPLQQAFSGMGRFYLSDFEAYKRAVFARRPFFGTKNEYGTNGFLTRRSHPQWYERKENAQKNSRIRFSEKVRKRFSLERTRNWGREKIP